MTSSPSSLIQRCNDDIDLLSLHAAHPERYPHLLQSTGSGGRERFDILFAFPGETLVLDARGVLSGPGPDLEQRFLRRFDHWWERHRQTDGQDIDLPFRGGWFLYLGYELSRQIEPRLVLPQDNVFQDWPVAAATRFPAAVIRDRATGRVWLVAEADRADLAGAMRDDIARLGKAGTASREAGRLIRLQEDAAEHFLDGVDRILRYICDGDVFQVNLSRQWAGEFATVPDDVALYRRLRRHNPGPFSGLARWPWGAVLSSSPERLVRVTADQVETRPIAGTRPRGETSGEDEGLSRELMAHPKERAEHIMLIDLERNDLGRVCVPGTVRVNELMALESYAHVHHIVSNIQGRLRPGTTPGDTLAAVFPGGTITGCPKVRCMEIIGELEKGWRGPYTGSMGYVNRNGDLDMNILIRTMVRLDRRLYLRAGAGIVADSVPRRELEETRDKAAGLLSALGAGNRIKAYRTG